MPGEINIYTCACEAAPGTTPPDLAPYVVSLQGLYGIITLNGTGVLDISTSGNTINFGLAAGAGLGTVTSVAASSSNSNLIIAGSPITTFGTLAFSLAGALNSISGLVTAADKMIYTTASDTYAVTDLSAFARTLLDDAAAVNARSTLGLVIGTNVQAWNADLDSFVTVATFTGANLALSGNLSAVAISGTSAVFDSNITATLGDITAGNDVIAGGQFTGSGAGITALNATNVSTGTLLATRGGTGFGSYAVGDLLSANTTTTLSKVAAVAAGSYLRSAGASTLPAWSTLTLPNAGTTGDVFIATATNTMGRVTGVATGNVFLSGGVGVIPAWGKVTSSHVDSTLATLTAGANANITSMTNVVAFTNTTSFADTITISATIEDGNGSTGSGGMVLTTNGTIVDWSNQITLDTLVIDTFFSTEGTITGAGTTGAQTINKICGTVRFAAAASSLVVTNNLATTSTRVLATVCTNDATAYVKNVTVTTGSFTIVLGAAATAETEVFWELRGIS